MLQYEGIDISEGIDIHKTNASKEFMLCHYWYFMLDLNLNHIFVMNVVLDLSFQKQKEWK